MATDFGQRLALALEHSRLSREELQQRVGIAQSTLSAALNHGHGSRVTVQLAVACGVNPIWLATGDGDMLDPLVVQPRTSTPQSKPPTLTAALSVVAQTLSGLTGAHLGMAKAGLHELIERPDELGSAVSALEALLASDTQIRKRLKELTMGHVYTLPSRRTAAHLSELTEPPTLTPANGGYLPLSGVECIHRRWGLY